MLGALLGALAVALSTAQGYWDSRGVPPVCDAVKVVFVSAVVFDLGPNPGAAAETNATCGVRVAWDRVDTRTQLCEYLTHEMGHVRLLRFPDNPSDPQHSLEEGIMHWDVGPEQVPVECMRSFTPWAVRRQRQRGWQCGPWTTLRWKCGKPGRYLYYRAI